MYQAGQDWSNKIQKGEKLGPRRLVVFGLLLKETEARMQLLLKEEDMLKRAKEAQWVDSAGRFNFQKWNTATKKLEIDETREGLTPDAIVKSINKLAELAKPSTITKFNAKQRRNEEPEEGDAAVFTVEVSLRSQGAQEIHQHHQELQDDAVWQLVGAQLRPPTLKRHGIAVALQKAGLRLAGPVRVPMKRQPSLAVPVLTTSLKQLSKMKFINAGNSCYLNSTIFAFLWQVHQRVDVVVPEAWKKILQGTSWAPYKFLQLQPSVTSKVARDVQGFNGCRELRTCMSSYSIRRTVFAQPRFKTPLMHGISNTLIML